MTTTSSSSSIFLQGKRPRDHVTGKECFWPANGAQYFHAVSLSTSANRDINAIRERNLEMQGKIAFYGYESVLPSSSSFVKQHQNTETSSQRQPSPKSRTSFLTPPQHSPPSMIGREVVVRSSSELRDKIGLNLVGKRGRIHSIPPPASGTRYCTVRFNDTSEIHNIPMSALTLWGGPSSSSKYKAAPSSVNKAAAVQQQHVIQQQVPSSAEMQALLQKQFQEVQALQQQYNDARRMNPALLPRIQTALATLRNTHLVQIQLLKQKQAMSKPT